MKKNSQLYLEYYRGSFLSSAFNRLKALQIRAGFEIFFRGFTYVSYQKSIGYKRQIVK